MAVLTKARMSVDEFLAWAKGRPGRYELHDGVVQAMAPETVDHAAVKGALYAALRAQIRARRMPCHALPDGVTVRVDTTTAYEPDALVYCGERVPGSSLEIPNPVIVVEVLSPATRRFDTSTKVAGYFRLPSVAHTLIVEPAQPLIVHHARGAGGAIVTRSVREGTIAFDPPGPVLALAEVYAAG